MSRKNFDEKIAKAHQFREFHPESGGLLELIEELAADLAETRDELDSTDHGVRI